MSSTTFERYVTKLRFFTETSAFYSSYTSQWAKRKFTSTLSSSVTSTLANLLPRATSSTSAAALTSALSRSLRRRPLRWARRPSSTRGSLISSRPSASAVSRLTSPCGSSSHRSASSRSSTPRGTATSSRT